MSAIEEHYPVDCPFCAITHAYSSPSSPEFIVPDGPSTSPEAPTAYVILNTPDVVAFLDHAPISRGHVLVIAREHRSKLSDCLVHEAQALGAWLPVISRAVMGCVHSKTEDTHANGTASGEVGDWNVVQNNGARAAQVVPHVHFHIIPRSGAVPEVKARSWTIFGRGQRQDLDDEDAETLVQQIREQLARELEHLAQTQGYGALESLIGIPSKGATSKL